MIPAAWSVEELNDACFVVRDANGQQLAYVYFEDEPGRAAGRSLIVARREPLQCLLLPGVAFSTRKNSAKLRPHFRSLEG